ncbi:MAG: cytochrome oxidase subunit IV [Proteobacteria bacterium]|nr:cytochrome oxidase subunit IV [Pseudomonadota bacterium]
MSAHAEHKHEVAPLSTYLGVYFTLLFLTIVTVGVSYLGLPSSISIVVAMIVASIKAFFVCAWFMHLLHDDKLNIIMFFASIWFMGIFFVFTVSDLSFRDRVMKYQGHFEYRQDRAQEYKDSN